MSQNKIPIFSRADLTGIQKLCVYLEKVSWGHLQVDTRFRLTRTLSATITIIRGGALYVFEKPLSIATRNPDPRGTS